MHQVRSWSDERLSRYVKDRQTDRQAETPSILVRRYKGDELRWILFVALTTVKFLHQQTMSWIMRRRHCDHSSMELLSIKETALLTLFTADNEWHLMVNYKLTSTFTVDTAAEPKDIMLWTKQGLESSSSITGHMWTGHWLTTFWSHIELIFNRNIRDWSCDNTHVKQYFIGLHTLREEADRKHSSPSHLVAGASSVSTSASLHPPWPFSWTITPTALRLPSLCVRTQVVTALQEWIQTQKDPDSAATSHERCASWA